MKHTRILGIKILVYFTALCSSDLISDKPKGPSVSLMYWVVQTINFQWGIISNLIKKNLLNLSLTQLLKKVMNQILNYQIQDHWTANEEMTVARK